MNEQCPKCKHTDLWLLSNNNIRGGVVFCPLCKNTSPFAPTTTKAMAEWEHLVIKTDTEIDAGVNFIMNTDFGGD